MRRLRGLSGRALALCIPGLAACLSATWRGAPADFPPRGYRGVLALRDPLERPDPSVQVTLGGRDRPSEAWLRIHTGATLPAVSPDTVRALGLTPDGTTRVRDARGTTRRVPKVRLPTLAAGGLLFRDVRADVDPTQADLGQSIVGHTPWEVDWARGTFTLGPALWADGASDVTVVALRAGGEDAIDRVTLEVEGRAIDMIVDTGADVSTLPQDFAASLRTEEARAWPGDSLEGGSTQRFAYGDAWLGTLHLGSRAFAVQPPAAGETGSLGLDVLRRFDVEVEPGRRLRLRARASLWGTARERVSRWSWLPSCEHVGCVTAHLEPADDDGVLTVAVEARVQGPLRVILACPDADPDFADPIDPLPVDDRRPASPRHVSLALGEVSPGSLTVPLPQARAWFERSDGCRDLAVLDVVPASPDGRPGGPLAQLVP